MASEGKQKDCGCGCNGKKPGGCNDKHSDHPEATNAKPDFSKMTTAEKTAYQKARRDRVFGW